MTILAWASFLLLVLSIVLHIWQLQRLDRMSAQIRDLPPSPEGTEKILTAIEGARMQISSTGDELRGQTSIIKERVQWLIARVDALIDRLTQFIKEIAK